MSIAIFWRWALVALIGGSVLLRLLLRKKIVELPTPSINFHGSEYLTSYLWWLCIIVALTSVLRRRDAAAFSKPRPVIDLVAIVAGACLLAFATIDHAKLPYLVHIACAGVDGALIHSEGRYALTTASKQRWFAAYGAIGLGALCLAAWLFFDEMRRGRRGESSKSHVLVGTASLAISAAYCVWFYRTGFPDASPDLAGQFNATWALVLSGVVLAIVAVSAGALRCASRRDEGENVTRIPVEATIPYSPLCAALMLIWVVWFVVDYVRVVVGYAADWSDVRDAIAYMAVDPDMLMQGAIVVLMLRFVYRLWKHRGQEEWVEIVPVDGRRLVGAWIALAALAVVGIPTIAASAFSFWLGPWYLW